MGNIYRFAERNTESFALADGVIAEALVQPKHLTGSIHEISGLNAFGIVGYLFAKETTIIIVGHEANLLTLGFLCQFLIPMLAGYLAHLRFGESAKRKNGSADILLRNHPEEVRLVFMFIYGCM